MAKNTIARWSNPEVILVATTLLEDHTLMQHAIFQARLSNATVLLVHVIPPSYLITEGNCSSPFILSSPTVRVIRAKLDEAVKEFQRAAALSQIFLASLFASEHRLELAQGFRKCWSRHAHILLLAAC